MKTAHISILGLSVAALVACNTPEPGNRGDDTSTQKVPQRPSTMTDQRPENPAISAPSGELVRVAGSHEGAMERDVELKDTMSNIKLSIVSPKPGDVVNSDVMNVDLSLAGYDTRPGGSHVTLMIDDRVFPPVYDAGKKSVEVDLKKANLSTGVHVVRAFATRPWHESVKMPQAIATSFFYYKEKTGEAPNLANPSVASARPSGTYHVTPSTDRVLLDFVVSGASIGDHGYKLRYTLDDTDPVVLTNWIPVWLEALPAGQHTVKFELLSADDSVVPNGVHPASRQFTIVNDGTANGETAMN
jgi:hypothetical protein